MGIGLVFWGVAEPIFHYAQPPMGIEPLSNQSAMMSFRYTFLHWGFHPWAIYAIVGLALAYVTFRKKMPCLISSTLYPLLGEKTRGPIGQVIDILALILTVIGVATSLGMGALQVNGGLNTLFNIPNNISTQVIIIIVITVLFLISATTGLDKGIKILSNTNIIIAVLLLLFVFLFGPTVFLIDTFFVSLSGYIQNILPMSLALSPFEKDPWIGYLDDFLLGLVAVLGTFCRYFYCQNIQGSDGQGVYTGSSHSAGDFLLFMVYCFWRNSPIF